MKKLCIIIDMDKILLDTASRKQMILKEHFSISKTLEEIKKYPDFTFPENSNTLRKEFLSVLNAEDTIDKYPASLFDNSSNVLNNLQKEGIAIYYYSSRPEKLRHITIAELSKLGLEIDTKSLFFQHDDKELSNTIEFKSAIIQEIGCKNFILALIGNDDDDFHAAALNHIPVILAHLNGQVPFIDITNWENGPGAHICNHWDKIEDIVKQYAESTKDLQDLRKQMIDNYSKWLGEIDNKLRVSVSIAGILCAICGKLLMDLSAKGGTKSMDETLLYSMLVIFLLSLISLVFALRSITSRFTSGGKSGTPVGVGFKHGFFVFMGKHRSAFTPGDAISDLENFKNYNLVQQKLSHRTFFYNQYKTYDTDAIWNHRFFSMRAANYSKLYGERLASKFLILSIVLFGLWLILNVFQSVEKAQTQPPTKLHTVGPQKPVLKTIIVPINPKK